MRGVRVDAVEALGVLVWGGASRASELLVGELLYKAASVGGNGETDREVTEAEGWAL